uniref:Uncharacterized protein n=2 Tax=Brassica oleracea TaxID=3712 RepID=A0A0D3DFV2_BRAOL|nr:unnamed protein product [Brassica oleracea]
MSFYKLVSNNKRVDRKLPNKKQLQFKLVPNIHVYRTIADPKSRVEIVCAEQVVCLCVRQAMMMLRKRAGTDDLMDLKLLTMYRDAGEAMSHTSTVMELEDAGPSLRLDACDDGVEIVYAAPLNSPSLSLFFGNGGVRVRARCLGYAENSYGMTIRNGADPNIATPLGREESPEIHHCAREIHREEAVSISCVSLLRKLQNTHSFRDLGDSSGSGAIRSRVSLVLSENSDGESLFVQRLRDPEMARALELRIDYVAANGDVVKAEEIAGAVRSLTDGEDTPKKRVKEMAEAARMARLYGGGD